MSSLTIKASIFISLTFFSFQSVALACTIEKGPTPLFAAYIKDVQQRANEIKSFASSNNKCNGTNGSFSSENRFLSLIDRVDVQTPAWGNIMTDFQYNIMLTAGGNSRGPVTNQGTLIRNLEKNTLIPALKNVAAACALDQRMANGKSPEEELSAMIANNRMLEGFYKQVALEDPRIPPDLTEYHQKLYAEIRDNYSPAATATCKGSDGIDSIEDVMTKIQERLQSQAKKTNDKQDDWEEAIALFAGKGKSTADYQKLQKRLLSAELARQGLTGKARDAMMKNLSCFQASTTPTSTPEEMGKARVDCTGSAIIGAENLTNWYKPLIFKATNTDEFIRRTVTYDRDKTRLSTDMVDFWKKVEATKNVDETLNEKMTTDLVNIHAELVATNKLLKTKIQEMYKNCMKARPDIACPQP